MLFLRGYHEILNSIVVQDFKSTGFVLFIGVLKFLKKLECFVKGVEAKYSYDKYRLHRNFTGSTNAAHRLHFWLVWLPKRTPHHFFDLVLFVLGRHKYQRAITQSLKLLDLLIFWDIKNIFYDIIELFEVIIDPKIWKNVKIDKTWLTYSIRDSDSSLFTMNWFFDSYG